MTIKADVLRYLRFNPGRSATQIAGGIDKKVGSVSSVIHDLLKTGMIVIAGDKQGPRGGLCYRLRNVPDDLPSNKTSWAHLLDDEGI